MRISWVEKEVLACGGIPISVENIVSLKEQGIHAIVTLTEHPLTVQKALPPEVLAEIGLELLHVPVVDQHPPTRAQVEQVARFVERMKSDAKAVYLHCHAGVGRTGTMAHAIYLLGGMNFDAVKDKIKATRPTSQFFMLSDTQKVFLQDLADALKR